MCVGMGFAPKGDTSNNKNREVAISNIASVLGITIDSVTDDMKLGPCVHYVASLVHFATGRYITVFDLGEVTVGDILKQL